MLKRSQLRSKLRSFNGLKNRSQSQDKEAKPDHRSGSPEAFLYSTHLKGLDIYADCVYIYIALLMVFYLDISQTGLKKSRNISSFSFLYIDF
jgi:hypothetical protein